MLPSASSMRFLDQDLLPETEYAYRVLAVIRASEARVGEINVRAPSTSIQALITALFPSHPNPFSDQTEIGFALAAASWVRLSIYDVAGRHVRLSRMESSRRRTPARLERAKRSRHRGHQRRLFSSARDAPARANREARLVPELGLRCHRHPLSGVSFLSFESADDARALPRLHLPRSAFLDRAPKRFTFR